MGFVGYFLETPILYACKESVHSNSLITKFDKKEQKVLIVLNRFLQFRILLLIVL